MAQEQKQETAPQPPEASEPEVHEAEGEVREETVSPADDNLQARFNELQDQHMRLAADFENFRKRVLQEREALLKYGAENTIQSLLPILDNLERASSSLSAESDPTMLYKSFELLSKQLTDTLTSQGLKRIETVGQPFDPNFHEATGQVDTGEYPENTVALEVQPGFQLHDRVLRPALVMVASGSDGGKTAEPPPVENAGPGNPFAQSE